MRAANADFLDHYASFANRMLTLTFRQGTNFVLPSQTQIDKLLKHFAVSLNWATWKTRTKHNAKAKILYVPVVEGLNGNKRVHIHILLANVMCDAELRAFVTRYLSSSPLLGNVYDLRDIHAADGISWYLTKETYSVNADAVRWECAWLPSAIIPKTSTLRKA
jgi:hypothetical protein